MGDFLSLDAVYVALVFVVPGYIISSFRAHFITGNRLDGADYFVRLLTLSAMNFVLLGWIIYLVINKTNDPVVRAVTWVFVVGIGPAILGFVSGIAAKKGWLRRIYGCLRLNPIHAVPTAWDYKFSTAPNSWVLVVLKDGSTFAGFWGGKSFASSRPEERDMLIEAVYEVPDGKPWTPTSKSVLISHGEIRSIEFMPAEGSTHG